MGRGSRGNVRLTPFSCSVRSPQRRTGHESGDAGFAHLDSNHTYDFARRDFENVDAHLVAGGFILFDDSADGSTWEVCRVVAEALVRDAYELVAKAPNYLVRER